MARLGRRGQAGNVRQGTEGRLACCGRAGNSGWEGDEVQGRLGRQSSAE